MDLCFDMVKKAEHGAPMILKHPGTGEPMKSKDGSDMGLLMGSIDSPQYKAALAEVRERNKAFAKGRKEKDIPEEMLEENGLRSIASVVFGFLPGTTYDGKPYSDDLVLEMFKRDPWIYEQVASEIYARNRFIEGSKTT